MCVCWLAGKSKEKNFAYASSIPSGDDRISLSIQMPNFMTPVET